MPSSRSQLAYAKRRRQERVAAGLCGACGAPPEPGYKTCCECLKRADAYRRDRIKRKACVQCEAPVERSGCYCASCADRRNADLRARYARNASAGLCRCGLERRPGKHNCERCFNERKSRKHGLSRVDAEQLLEAQNRRCKICARECRPDVRAMRPEVDHCHATGRVRGVLCQQCNHVVGWIEKAVREDRLSAVLDYIRSDR